MLSVFDSVLAYNFLLLFCVICAFLAQNAKQNIRKPMLIMCYGAIVIFSSIRFDIGHDYYNYYLMLKPSVNILNPVELLIGLAMFEPFHFIVTYISQQIDDSIILMMSIYSLFTTFFLWKINERYAIHTVGIFLYFTLGIFAVDLDQVRQGLAMMVVFWGLKFIENKQLKKWILLVLMATCIHYSAFISMIMYWASKVKPRPFLYICLIIIFFIGYHLRIWESYRHSIFSLIPYYGEKYAMNIQQLSSKELGSGLGLIAKILFVIYIIFQRKKIKPLFVNIAFIGIIILLFSNGNLNFDRIANYYFFSLMISMSLAYRLNRNRILLQGLLFVSLLVFEKETISSTRGQTPYETVFSDEYRNKRFRQRLKF